MNVEMRVMFTKWKFERWLWRVERVVGHVAEFIMTMIAFSFGKKKGGLR